MKYPFSSLFCLAIVAAPALPARGGDGPRFTVQLGPEVEPGPVDGRLLVMLSTDPTAEPRDQITDAVRTQQIFGVDVEGLVPGRLITVDAAALGYPVASLREVPRGTYRVQALLHKYETFHRADGQVLKLPMDRGEGQQWNKAPGNLLSTPVDLALDPDRAEPYALALDHVIPPIPAPATTTYIKHDRIESQLLTKFWGRPMHLGAHVLLPEGFDEHPDAHYPLVIFHGHHPATFGGFRATPPDADLKPDDNDRFKLKGYNRIVQQSAYDFYKEWTGPNFPRMIIVEIQHANPFYDDSYAVNSANVGPYGDAIVRELIPYLEAKYRGIGQGWARFLYGGSTGGWEALAAQVFYPDEFNGCFAACPDPIDFRAYTVVNLYEDKNAYHLDGPWRHVQRPGHRDVEGQISTTLEDMNRRELVLGTKTRSGQQWDIWEAVFSPVGPDGYPQRIWDKTTGVIDPAVAAHWRENYDLAYIMKRDWAKLGPKLAGKIHLYVGEADNYYLNNAVHLTEDFLTATTNPPAAAEVAYGCRDEHCWNGDPTRPNALSRLRYNQMYVAKILDRLLKTAPAGADLTSWRY